MKILKNKLLQMLLLATFVGASLSSCDVAATPGVFNIPEWLVGNWKGDPNLADRQGDNPDYTFTTDEITDNVTGDTFSEILSTLGQKKEGEVSNDNEYSVTLPFSATVKTTYRFVKKSSTTLDHTVTTGTATATETLTKY